MGTQKQPVVWAGSWLAGSCCAVEAVSLPGSSPLVLKRSEAQQGEPMGMAFAGHQFPRALADALGKPAAHETPMIEEEPQQIQIRAAQMATQGEVGAQPALRFSTSALLRGVRARAWLTASKTAWNLPPISARSRFHPCQYAVEVV